MAGNRFGAAAADANYETAARYLLEIDGIAIMSFEKVTVNSQEWGLIESRSGGDNLTKHTASGLKKPTTIVIEKHARVGGISDVKEIVDWFNSGSKERKSGSVVLLDRDEKELIRMNFKNAWVMKHTPPDLDAASDNSELIFIFELSVSEITYA